MKILNRRGALSEEARYFSPESYELFLKIAEYGYKTLWPKYVFTVIEAVRI
jgi:hypothetical protein